MTIEEWNEGKRKLISAATYLELQWTLNHPEDSRRWDEWYVQESDGRAAHLLHYMAAAERFFDQERN